MKVNGPAGRNVGQVEGSQSNLAKNVEQKAPRAPEEKIQVSSLSKLLSQVKAGAPEAPDMQKVDRIRESIHAGTFQVNPERTAEAMMAEEM
jgi:flagellar biosynthesis anti-sigma factor FlgM